MKNIGRTLLLSLAVLASTGCATLQIPIATGNCLDGAKVTDAVVVIYLDRKTNRPAANPPDCYVPAGGNVTFTTTDDATEGFKILFDKGDGSPAKSNDGDFVGVKKGAKAYLVNTGPLKAYRTEGGNTFAYTIDIGGKRTDPSLIIYPN